MGRKLCGQPYDVRTHTQKALLEAPIRGSGTAYVQCVLGLINLSKAEDDKIWQSRVNTPPPAESDGAGEMYNPDRHADSHGKWSTVKAKDQRTNRKIYFLRFLN